MSRSKYKLSISKHIYKLNTSIANKKRKPLYFKGEFITPELYGSEIEIYNGNKIVKLRITSEMGGEKLGSFITTRKPCIYKKKMKNKGKKKILNNPIMTYEYLSILIYIIASLIISIILLLASYLLAVQQTDPEKISAYECGFNPFDDARHKFDVRFYLVGILFIIFDLEVMFLFPWTVILNKINEFGYYSMMIFLLILTIGFIYEWKKGALDWE